MPNPPIFAATFRGDVASVKKLLDRDDSLVAIRDAKNLTPLHVAASRGKTAVAQLLITYGADVHGPTEPDEWTPLVFAAYRGHLDVARVLIESGAGITLEDGNPIHYAGQRKHKEICRLLVDHGAIDDLVDSDDPDVLRLFRSAYRFDSISVNDILTRRPSLVDCRDRLGRTLLHETCTFGDTKTVRVLLGFDSDMTIRDDNGQTPADRASVHRQHRISELLKRNETEG